jgi:hypothetical protein
MSRDIVDAMSWVIVYVALTSGFVVWFATKWMICLVKAT